MNSDKLYKVQEQDLDRLKESAGNPYGSVTV